MSSIVQVVEGLRRKVERENATENAGYTKGTWVPTFTGFSANPASGVYRYVLIGKLCTCLITMPNTGTSNAVTFQITLPFTAATASGMEWFALGGVVTDNGATSTTPGSGVIVSAGTFISLYKDDNGTAWTSSGAKGMKHLCITYEVA